MIDKQISHYHILEKLGEGGMGVVYKAEDTKLKRTVALKFLPPELTRDPEAKARFIREAQAASALEHTNICNIHEIGETEDHQLFIVMSCYEGQTLKESIGTIQMAIDKVIDIAIQTAEGLQEAHAKNIIHRDIKPANIMITEKGQVKIMDFGLAKLLGRTLLTKEGTTLGTVAYMSPEQVRGETVDHRTDIWSLGVILYEMVTGKPPFKGEYDQVVMYSISNEEPEPLTAVRSGVPMELERITSKMLAKDPAERYQHLDELLVDLKKVKTTRDRSKVSTASEIPRRKSVRMLYAVSGIIILVIIGVASWTILQKRSDQQQKRKFIAVLPFHPITKSEEDQSFAEGIHDDILTQLAKIAELKVIARTSVMQYQNTQKTIRQIASELGVGVVLEGSTRRNDNIIRITAQLIDGETEEHLWAESYDEPYADVFDIQSNIAQKIASALQVRLAEEELRSIQTQPTKNMLAYEYYQKGKYFWNNSFNYEGNLKAAQMFEKACILDTTFALAWAWQAITYSTISMQSSSISQWDVFVRKSEFALKKTESLAPDLPEVNLARYHYLNNIKNDLDAALKEIEIANLKRPNDGNILYSKSYLMTMTGDPQSGLTLAEKVYQLDPKGIGGAYFAAWNTMLLGRYQEAERWSDIMIANNPESGEGYHMKMSAILAGSGDLDRAEIILTEAQKLVTRDRWNLTIREYLLYLYKRDYHKALLALAGWEFPERFLYRAAVFQLLNNRQEAIANFDSARIFYLEILNQQPYFRWTSTRLLLAVAYAGLGEKSKAIQEMVQVADLSRIQQTSMRGLEDITFYLMLGDEENAFLQLEKAVASYFGPTPAELRLDPRLDPLRDDLRFNELIHKAESFRKN